MTELSASGSASDLFPTHILGEPEVRDLPAAPENTARIIGPGIVAAGVGLASGEFILYPYIASQVGLVFVWAALVGVVTQFSSTWRSSATRSPPARPRSPASAASGGTGGSCSRS
jgi:hypothetical protein